MGLLYKYKSEEHNIFLEYSAERDRERCTAGSGSNENSKFLRKTLTEFYVFNENSASGTGSL